MTTDLQIRIATKKDLPAILALYAQPDFDAGKVLPMEEAERIFARFAAYPDYHLYIALSAGRPVGTFALLIMENLGHMGTPSGVIEDVAVDATMRGQGIGKAMMRHAIELCRAKGCYKVALSSNLRREQAHAFYDALGFERHGYSFRVPL